MNRGCHRNVFNRRTGTWQAVAEIAPARGKAASSVSPGAGAAFAALALVLAMGAGPALAQTAVQQATTQLVLRPNAALPSSVSISNPTASRTLIEQTSRTAVINWNRFNLGRGDTVQFQHKNAAGTLDNRGATLNRIWDASPSLINGRIEANGSVYLVNRNGIVFGPDATVDVGSLVASALNIKDSVFEAGYLSLGGSTRAAFSFDDRNYELVAELPAGALPTVRNEGRLGAASGGSIFLFAPQVENTGRITTTAGQAVLAAGQKVYLAASTDANLRGVLVEVDAFAGGQGSRVVNDTPAGQLQGILAERGNITLAALAVNNNGRLEATTGKTENGSIRLQARDGVVGVVDDGAARLVARHGGTLTLGERSTIVTPVVAPTEAEIQAEVLATFVPAAPGESTAVTASRRQQTEDLVRKRYTLGAGETLRASQVVLDAGAITVAGGAVIRSPGGDVRLTAEATRFADGAALTTLRKTDTQHDAGERIVIAPGATIDVSGLAAGGETLQRGDQTLFDFRPVVVDGATNQVSAVLVSNELKDAPLQRDGVLYKKTVHFNRLDAPTGVLGVADVSGTLAARTTTLAQAATKGGSLTLQAEDAVVLGQGAVLDVSGGSTAVSAATIKTTVLTAGTTRTDITQASGERRYDGLVTVEREVPAYTEGAAGGTLLINSRSTRLDGTMMGRTEAGRFQTSAATLPGAARLVIGDAEGGSVQDTINFESGSLFNPLPLTLGRSAALASDFWQSPLSAPVFGDGEARVTAVSPDVMAGGRVGGGFGDVRLYAGGALRVAADVAATPGAALRLTGLGTIGLDAGITLRGAGLTLSAVAAQVDVGAGATIDASGQWLNDLRAARGLEPAYAGLRWLDGGSLTLGASGGASVVTLGEGARLDVSGGARLGASGSLTAGNAGSITLEGLASAPEAGALRGQAFATSATAGGTGGTLVIRTPASVTIGGPEAGGFALDAGFFADGGFANRTVATTQGNLHVAAGTQISAGRSLVDGRLARDLPSLSDRDAIAALPTLALPDGAGDRQSLTLSAAAVLLNPARANANPEGGRVSVGEGARIDVGSAGTLSLAAKRSLDVQGTLAAAGGTLNLTMAGSVQSLDDEGFFADQAIHLTDTATLDVAGRSRVAVNALGQRSGTVLAGGTVNLLASKGDVIVDGATIHLDGASDRVDVAADGRRLTLASDAGAINIRARERVLLDAEITQKVAAPTAAGARLALTLEAKDRAQEPGSASPPAPGGLYPQGERIIVVGAGITPDVTALGDARAAYVDTARLQGFSSVTLSAQDAVRFEGTATLSATRQIALDTPRLDLAAGAQATVAAPFVELRQTDITRSTAAPTPAATGDGQLRVQASQQLDLRGAVAITGAAQTMLASAGDVRLAGVVMPGNDGSLQARGSGSLTASGSLALEARQVYAASDVDFDLTLPVAGSTLTLSRAAGSTTPAVPLSAGASVRLEADTVVQAGVLRAPLGTIELVGRSTLTLAEGSLTSASAEGSLLPYAELENGSAWLRTTGNGQALVAAAPVPTVALRAPRVTQAAGSRVDLAGGGDLYAYEFVAGPGGSTDVLAQAGTYAVLPGFDAASAPLDALFGAGFDKAIGTQVTLAAGGGLAAGTYTLLPAHYALLPGAFRVSLVKAGSDLAPGSSQAQPLGGALVSGTEGTAGTALQAQRSGTWLVESGAVVRQRSQYTEARANTAFTAAATASGSAPGQRPMDAGHLIVAAESAWQAEGTVALNAASGGRGGRLDLSASDITVTASGSAAPPTADRAAGLTVGADTLARLGAASVVIGGERTIDGASGASALTVTARQVGVAADTTLQAAELVLAADEAITLSARSALGASGAAADAPAITTVGAGALIRVGTDARDVRRSQGAGSQGVVLGAEGVTLTGASVQVDASVDTRLAADTRVLTPRLTLGAAAFRFSEDDSASTGLTLGEPWLASINAQAGALTLRSYSGFDFARSLSLGTAASPLSALTLDGGHLAWAGSAPGAVQVHAQALTLQNTTGAAAPTPITGASPAMLTLSAPTITLGDGTVQVVGFEQLTLAAAEQLRFDGQGQLRQQGDAHLGTPLITGTANTRHGLAATGRLVTEGTGATAGSAGAAAQITMEGRELVHGTTLSAAGGKLTLRATAGDVQLTEAAVVAATGRETTLGGQAVASDAGSVTLASRGGDVALAAGARVDVGARGNATAGSLAVSAPEGTLRNAGTLATQGGGSFSLDTGRLDSLDTLNTQTAGFTTERSVRLREGDLVLGAGQTMTARSITLAADLGNVTIEGTLDARAPQGGRIELAARRALASDGNARGGQVNLAATAVLDARATTAGASGGEVLISVSADSAEREADTAIAMAAGSRIDVSGGQGGAGGTVTLRTPRLNSASDWQVQSAALTLVGTPSALVGTVDLADTTVYSTRALAASAARASFAPTASVTGTGGNRTLQFTLAASTDLSQGFFFTWNSGSINVNGNPTLRVTLDNGTVVGGTTGLTAQIFQASSDAGVANPTGTALTWAAAGFTNGATYFVQRRNNRWVIDTRITPVGASPVELLKLTDSAVAATPALGSRVFFELADAPASRRVQVWLNGKRYALKDADGNDFTAASVLTDLPAGTRLAAELVGSATAAFAGTLRLLNRPGGPTPVGLTVAGLSAHTALRAIRFAATEDVAGTAVALYVNNLAPQLLRSADGSGNGGISASAVNTVAWQGGSYYVYAAGQQRYITAENSAPFADSTVLVFRPTQDVAATATQPLRLKVGADTLDLRDAAGNALASITAGQAYYAVRDGAAALRLVPEENIASRLTVNNAGAQITGAATVVLEGVKTVQASVVDAALQARLQGASKLFDSQRDNAVARALGASASTLGTANVRVTPAFEIQSRGDLVVSEAWNLASRSDGQFDWRFGASGESAGALTLRAAGTLRVAASVTDAATLATGSARAPSDQSWTLRLVGGADLSAASLGGTRADGQGDIVLGTNAQVQTGTADIALTAAGSVRFGANASVFTTGARFQDAVFKDFEAPVQAINSSSANSQARVAGGGYYTQGGGSITLRAGADVVGQGERSPSDWWWAVGSYLDDGTTYRDNPAWWVRPDRFTQALGTLGGGNIAVHAGGDVRQLSAMLPTQGRVTGTGVTDGVAHVIGGGNLSVQAGGDIADGQFLVDQGRLTLTANGAIGGSRSAAAGPRLYLGDAQATLAASGDLQVAQITSGTAQLQSALVSNLRAQTSFFRYTEETRVDLQSAAGDIRVAAPTALADGSRAQVLPPTLTVAALEGGVRLPDLDLAPSPTGGLTVLANGSVTLGSSGGSGVRLRDVAPDLLPSAVAPAWGNPTSANDTSGYAVAARNWGTFSEAFLGATGDAGVRVASASHTGSLHASDTEPVRVVSATGDVSGTLVAAKVVQVSAGRDVSNLSLTAQNLTADDTTTVVAGRDITFPEQRDAQSQTLLPNTNGVRVFGPGALTVSAGRHVLLGASRGLTTEGPGDNPALSDRGASLVVTAGTAARADGPVQRAGFVARYLSGAPGLPDYRSAWTAFAAANGLSTDVAAAPTEALDRFRTAVMWQELAIAGTEGNAIKADAEANPGKYTQAELDYRRVYGRGYTAIALAGWAPAEGAAASGGGDVRMSFSQIKTRAGGSVEVLAPAGSLAVGSTRALGAKTAAELGLVATEGDALALVNGSIAVNTSRWFAIDGGNILGWASTGDIDAGRGARTAVSGSSQRLDVDVETGRFRLVDAGGASGSGIATIFNRPVAGGDVKLFAPNGVIDAGEAGIRSAGSLTLTLNVANADFIVAVGASNAPAAPAAPSLAGLSLGNSSTSSAEATVAASPTAAGTRERNGLLTVEVLPGSDAPAAKDDDDKRRARQACLDKANSDAQRKACAE